MHQTDQKTHDIVATTCLYLGRPCPAAERMLLALAGALNQARAVTRADFEITGDSQLDGCEKACPARFAARHDRIRVFCDVTTSADTADLDRFADAMLSTGLDGLSAPPREMPRAFGEARPLRLSPQPDIRAS